MVMYCQELRKLENNFNDLEYLYILWEKNEIADELAKLSSNRATVPLGGLYSGTPWAKHLQGVG
jgi:hypothetical protein